MNDTYSVTLSHFDVTIDKIWKLKNPETKVDNQQS